MLHDAKVAARERHNQPARELHSDVRGESELPIWIRDSGCGAPAVDLSQVLLNRSLFAVL